MKRRLLLVTTLLTLLFASCTKDAGSNGAVAGTPASIRSTVVGYQGNLKEKTFGDLSDEKIWTQLDEYDAQVHQMATKEEIAEYVDALPEGVFLLVYYDDDEVEELSQE